MEDDSKAIVPNSYYQPAELLNIFKNFLTHKEINMTVICLKGIYIKSDKVYGHFAYDHLKDETQVEELTIVVPIALRDDLKNGNLITVYGTIDRKLNPSGYIQILLNVSRIDKVKEIAISDEEVKRAELRRIKEQNGYKNVDSILENKLFIDERPQVALIYAETSITNADFEKGLVAAKTHIDFHEIRVNFANSTALRQTLLEADSKSYDVIAIVRGGGSGIEKLDEITIIETLANLQTAWIYGVGHENLFIRNVADKVIPIPFALGTYFRDTVENVRSKRNSSRAAIMEEVKKQYIKQIEDSNKKNQELNKQLETMQKTHKEQTEASNKQIAELTRAQKENQEQIKLQTEALKKANESAQQMVQKQTEQLRKANEESQKQARLQIEAAAKTNKELQDKLSQQGKTLENMQLQQKQQQAEFNKSLEKMQENNNNLQSSLSKLTALHTQTSKELADAKEKNLALAEQLKNAKQANPTAAFIKLAIIMIGLIIIAILGFTILR